MLLGLVLPTAGRSSCSASRCRRPRARCCPQVGALVEGPAAYGHLSGAGEPARCSTPPDRAARRRTRAARIDEVLEQVGLGGGGRPAGEGLLARHAAAAGLAAALLRRPSCWCSTSRPTAWTRRASREIRELLLELNAGRDDRVPVQPPAGRGRAAVHPGRRARPRPAGAAGRARRAAPPTGPAHDRAHPDAGSGPRRARRPGRPRGDGERLVVAAAATRPSSTRCWSARGCGSPGCAPSGRTLEDVVLEPTGRGEPGPASDARPRGAPVIGVELRKLFRRPRTWVTIAAARRAAGRWSRCCSQVTELAPRPGQGRRSCPRCWPTARCSRWRRWRIVLPLFLPIAVAVDRRRRDRGRGPGRHAALPAGPAGRAHPAAGGQAGRRASSSWWSPWSLVAAVGLRGRPAAVRHPGRRRRAAVRSGTPLTAAGSWSCATVLAVGYVGGVDARGRGVRAVPLHAHRLPAGRDPRRRSRCWSPRRCCSPSTPPRAIRPYLPTRYWLSFVDLFRDPVLLARHRPGHGAAGASTSGCCCAASWARFTTKDVTS